MDTHLLVETHTDTCLWTGSGSAFIGCKRLQISLYKNEEKTNVMHRRIKSMCTAKKKKKEITSTRLLMSNPYDCLTVSIIQGLVFQKHCSVTIILSIRMVQIVTAFMTTLFFFFFFLDQTRPSMLS